MGKEIDRRTSKNFEKRRKRVGASQTDRKEKREKV